MYASRGRIALATRARTTANSPDALTHQSLTGFEGSAQNRRTRWAAQGKNYLDNVGWLRYEAALTAL